MEGACPGKTGLALFSRACFLQIGSDLLINVRIVCHNVGQVFTVNIPKGGEINRFRLIKDAEAGAASAVYRNFFIEVLPDRKAPARLRFFLPVRRWCGR